MCQSHFFNKVAGLSLQLYQKRDSGTGAFLQILCIFFIERLWSLPLKGSASLIRDLFVINKK